MFDSMRRPIFVIALVLMGIAVLVELASTSWLTRAALPGSGALNMPLHGQAIPALPLLDGLILYALLMIGIAILIPERTQSKFQGIVTAVVALLLLLATTVRLMANIQLLSLMVSLLLAAPFGTVAYMILWGVFKTDPALGTLSAVMALKLAFAVCLIVSQQLFLKNKGLVLIILTSLALNLLTTFLYGFVPGFLVSIADVISAIAICGMAALWMVVYLVGGVLSVIKVIL